jgi:hypothetical protein
MLHKLRKSYKVRIYREFISDAGREIILDRYAKKVGIHVDDYSRACVMESLGKRTFFCCDRR